MIEPKIMLGIIVTILVFVFIVGAYNLIRKPKTNELKTWNIQEKETAHNKDFVQQEGRTVREYE